MPVPTRYWWSMSTSFRRDIDRPNHRIRFRMLEARRTGLPVPMRTASSGEWTCSASVDGFCLNFRSLLRQADTRLAFTPCWRATAATETPGASDCARTTWSGKRVRTSVSGVGAAVIRARVGSGRCSGQCCGLATGRTPFSPVDWAMRASAGRHAGGRTGRITSNSTSTDCAPRIQRRSMPTATAASFAARTITREDGGAP